MTDDFGQLDAAREMQATEREERARQDAARCKCGDAKVLHLSGDGPMRAMCLKDCSCIEYEPVATEQGEGLNTDG